MRAPIFVGFAALAVATSVPTGAAEDQWGDLPSGEGRQEVLMYCSACHSTRIIVQQGMSRERWDDTLEWMVEEQGMSELDPKTREVILDYLAEKFPPERPNYPTPRLEN